MLKQAASDIKKVLVVGSGGLAIGQAGEFDYSGSRALSRELPALVYDSHRSSMWELSLLPT